MQSSTSKLICVQSVPVQVEYFVSGFYMQGFKSAAHSAFVCFKVAINVYLSPRSMFQGFLTRDGFNRVIKVQSLKTPIECIFREYIWVRETGLREFFISILFSPVLQDKCVAIELVIGVTRCTVAGREV